MKVGFHRENVHFVKMCVSPRREHDFKVSQCQNSMKVFKRMVANCDVKNDPPKKTEKNGFGLEFWRPWPRSGRPGAAQERPKSGSRRLQDLGLTGLRALCDALGRSKALSCDFQQNFIRFWFYFANIATYRAR